jgi:cyclophilin family peptidyl-prolyl cis-trans isomerase
MRKPLAAIVLSVLLGMFFRADIAAQSVVMSNPEAKVTQTVTMETSKGTIVLGLYGDDAPKTVANFIGLAEKNFYNGILFHRVVPGFVIQAGDPKTKDPNQQAAWGTGGESIYGREFEDELNPATASYKTGYARGVLAMANRGPNTNTSQFFICLADLAQLPRNYTMFGRVMKGMEVVDAIAKVELAGSMPKEPVRILSISTKAVKK